MKTFYVSYPTCGSVSVEVEAEDEESAIAAGWNKTGDADAEHQWEPMEHIVQGNVFYGETNDIYVEEA